MTCTEGGRGVREATVKIIKELRLNIESLDYNVIANYVEMTEG